MLDDYMVELELNGEVSFEISTESGMPVIEQDSYMPGHYWADETTMPCDSIEVTFTDKDELLNYLESIDTGSPKKCACAGDYIDKEIVESDISDDLVRDNELHAPPTRKWRSYDCFDKLVYALNKANVRTSALEDIVSASKYADLTPSEELSLNRLYIIRRKAAVESIAIREYSTSIRKAYTQGYLLKIAKSIKEDNRLSKSGKSILRKLFKMIDYKICSSKGWKSKMLFPSSPKPLNPLNIQGT